MAAITIKGTYALDPETVRMLDDLARKRGTSKSAVLRDAIRQAVAAEGCTAPGAVGAFDKLLDLVARDREAIDTWARGAESERKASSTRREKRR